MSDPVDTMVASDRTTVHDSLKVEEVTTFSDQAETQVQSTTPLYKVVNLNPYYDTTLIQFLERPFEIDTFTWITGNTGTRLRAYSFPDSLFKVTSLFFKITNFAYFRAGIKLSVRVNATRFHYGTLLISTMPNMLNGGIGYTYNSTVYNTVYDNIISHSGMRHVLLKPTSNNVVELEAPYTLPFQYVCIEDYTQTLTPQLTAARTMQDIAGFQIWVLNSLQAADSTPPGVQVTVFAQFTDVQLAGYSAFTGLYQANNPAFATPPVQTFVTNSSINPIGKINYKKPMEMQGFAAVAAKVAAHAGYSAVGNTASLLTEGKMKSEKGIISSTLESISEGISGLVEVPVIGTIASWASWLAGWGGTIANFIGFSLPHSQQTTQPVLIRYQDFSQVHGLSDSTVLGNSQENEVFHDYALMGSDIHEMMLSNIINRPAIVYDNVLILASQGAGDQVIEFPVKPCLVPVVIGSGVNPTVDIYYTPVAKIASNFEYWRGTMRYRFQFVASSFHSARFRLTWHPTFVSTAYGTYDIMSAINRVIDISTETTVDIEVPYLNPLPYLRNSFVNYHYQFDDSSPYNKNSFPRNDVDNGYLELKLLTPLAHPTSPIPAISLNVWISASFDMQFAKPTAKFMANDPILNTGTTEMMEMQGKDESVAEDYKSIIPSRRYREKGSMHGEEFSNLKELLMKSTAIRLLTTAEYSVHEFLWYKDGPIEPGYARSYYDWNKDLFRYCSGSTRYKFTPFSTIPSGTGDFGLWVASVVSKDVAEVTTSRFVVPILPGNSSWPTDYLHENGIIYPPDSVIPRNITVPFYCNTPFIVNNIGKVLTKTTIPATLYYSIIVNGMYASFSVGDDFVMGNQVGPCAYRYHRDILN